MKEKQDEVKLAIELSDEDVDKLYQEYIAKKWLKLVYGGKGNERQSNCK